MTMINKIILIIGLTFLLLIIFEILYKLYKKQINEIEYRILILEKRCNDNRKDTYLLFEKLYNKIIDYEVRIEKIERKIKRIKGDK